jgi:hypothetical protein
MLKATLVGAGGCTLGEALGLLGLSAACAASGGVQAMPPRRLGRTAFDVPIFSLGGESTIEQPGKLDDAGLDRHTVVHLDYITLRGRLGF